MTKRKRPWITLTPAQAKLLCDELQQKRPGVALAAHLMVYLGLRLNEARLLDHAWLHDLGTPAAHLTIPAEVTKTKQQRDLPIPPQTTFLLDLLTTNTLQIPIPFPGAPQPVITKTTGARYTHRGIQKSIRAAAIRALGFPVRPVSLRHTFATELLKHTNIRVVQLALGHRSLTSTQIYTHPAFNDLKQAMDTAFTATQETHT